MTPRGWECPKCGMVYAPWVFACQKCAVKIAPMAWQDRGPKLKGNQL